MARQRHDLEPAFVLHARPFRETSLLLECFSRQHGRMGLVARGARRPRSRWQGMLRPFQPLLLSWLSSGELGTLVQAERTASALALAGEALYCGLYVNELTLRLTARADPHEDLFAHYTQCLSQLAEAPPQQRAPVLRHYELHLLEALGLGPDYQPGSATEAAGPEPGACYNVSPDWRLRPAFEGSGQDSSASARNPQVSGAVLLALQAGDFSQPSLWPDMRRLLQAQIRHQLGDRPLASQTLLRKLLREQEGK